uniref:Anhydro-N-acetylmuramic acid kinase (AnhMurNAc kinase) n=1 Tax=mine drainage metagenome TaxID=410659 RepID=E6QM97_9ZZZZ
MRSMIVAGIMSGTSVDGIDVAVTRIRASGIGYPKVSLLAHHAFPFSPALRRAILSAMNASSITTAELARLNWRLGVAYTEAVTEALRAHPVKLDLIGCHGQTLYHQAKIARYQARSFACTWQAGEAALIASAHGVPVVSNFRPADIAAGGQGAPLVPLLDFVCFRHPRRARVLQNIGGIANLTAIPPGLGPERLIAFDTGPGNMVIDALMNGLYGKQYDDGGAVAASGTILAPVLEGALRHAFFRKTPPRAAGREDFGREYAADFLRRCQQVSRRKQDVIATATALTAHSIASAYLRFAQPHLEPAPVDFIVSGGGARNLTLLGRLDDLLRPHRCKIMTSDAVGIPPEAKEAVAFALLAWQTWHALPGNLCAATGARRPAVLGQICHG